MDQARLPEHHGGPRAGLDVRVHGPAVPGKGRVLRLCLGAARQGATRARLPQRPDASPVAPVVQTRQYHKFRAGLFASLGGFGVFPLLHFLLANYHEADALLGLLLVVLMGVIYLGGASIYAFRVPERFKPGYFDLWFHSHQARRTCTGHPAAGPGSHVHRPSSRSRGCAPHRKMDGWLLLLWW